MKAERSNSSRSTTIQPEGFLAENRRHVEFAETDKTRCCIRVGQAVPDEEFRIRQEFVEATTKDTKYTKIISFLSWFSWLKIPDDDSVRRSLIYDVCHLSE
jgi:hypothetical protein